MSSLVTVATAQIVVVAVVAQRNGLQIAKALASQIMFIQTGLEMGIVMRVYTYLQIMVALNVQQVLLFG
jgi:hypothetical protein